MFSNLFLKKEKTEYETSKDFLGKMLFLIVPVLNMHTYFFIRWNPTIGF